MPIRESPAAKRNRVPIGDALQKYLKEDVVKHENPRLLEIASGCGTHIMYFSKLFPHIHWQPSDFQGTTIKIHKEKALLNNIKTNRGAVFRSTSKMNFIVVFRTLS